MDDVYGVKIQKMRCYFMLLGLYFVGSFKNGILAKMFAFVIRDTVMF